MKVKKYNPFVVMNKPKSTAKPKSKPRLEAGGWGTKGEAHLSLENKKKLDVFYDRGFVKTSKK